MLLSTKARFVSALALYLLGNLLRSVLPLSRHPFGSYLFFYPPVRLDRTDSGRRAG